MSGARLRLAAARWLLRGTGWQAASTTLLDATADLLEQYEQDARKRRRLLRRLWAKRRDDEGWWEYPLIAHRIATQGEYAPSAKCELSGEDRT